MAIVLMSILLFGVMSIFQFPYGHVVNIIQGFYREPKNTIDVVLVGASEVSAGYSAPVAFKLFGYTSYPYAIDGNQVRMIQYELNEIYAHQNPKVILIDIGCMSSYSHAYNDDNFDGRFRAFINNIPLSTNKIQAIDNLAKQQEKTSYYLPFITYHGFIPNTDYAQFLLSGENKLKGTYARSSKIEEAGNVLTIDSTVKPIKKEYETEILDLLRFCKNKGCNVVFTRFPNRINNEDFLTRFQECNYIKNLIQEQGFPFFDCMTSELMNSLDYQQDFYTNDHMSLKGQKKLTEFIGKKLTKEFGISKTDISSVVSSKWFESVSYIEAFYDYMDKIEKGRSKDQDIYYFETSELIRKLDSIRK